MHDSQMADRPHLELRWIPVTDAQGHTHLESVWIDAGALAPDHAPHAA